MRALFKLCFLAFCGAGFAQDATSVGKVIATEGVVTAGTRRLTRGASIFLSDVVTTAIGAKAQIRFTDGSIVNLIADTKYQINQYAFSDAENSIFATTLLKGGLRTVSGEIGKVSPEKYSIGTPTATLGIRGTLFMINIAQGSVFFGVDTGSITVTNNAGSLSLNAGQYVRVPSSNTLDTITEIRPAQLSENIFTTPTGGESLESTEASIQEGPEEVPSEAPTEGEVEEEPAPESGNTEEVDTAPNGGEPASAGETEDYTPQLLQENQLEQQQQRP